MSYTTYLAHHGIKGQKWGVRRFQKADGSLTAAGAKRYGIKSAMSAGRKVGAGLVKAARGGIQKAKEAKARKAAEKLERQKKVWAKTRLGLTMNADKFTVEELREANNRLDERDRAARGLAEQVKRGVGYFQAIRDVTGAIKDTKDYIEDISGEKGKKAKAADELKYQRELEKEKRTYERDMVRDQLKANQEYEYKREKDKLDRESKEKIEKMKAKAKKKKDSGSSDSDQEPDDAPKKKKPSENTTEFEDVYWNSSKKDREFMETVFPKEVDEAKERKKRRNKARREVDEAIRRMGFFGHSDISIYGAYLEHHGIKGQKWGVRRFQNEDGTLTKAGLKRAGYKFKTIRKNATTSRILIDENEDTSKLDRAYFSTNNLDNQKWANYFASIGAQHLDKSAYAVNFKAKKKLIIARGEEISKVASKLMDKDDTFRKEFEATRQKQIQSTGSEEAWDSLSESAKYSAMIAYKCEGGKKIISAMKDIGFDGVEDLFGKDVSKDPIIIFNPGSNLRQVGQKQELKGLYRGYRKYYGLPINHSSFSCHNISDNAGDSNHMFMNDDLSTYGAYLEHHGIKGQKWGIRRFQNEDGTLTKAGLRRNEKAEKFRDKELKRYNKNIDRAIARGQTNTKQMYEKLADHLVKMTVDDIYKEHRAVRTKAIGKAVLAGVATTLASSFAGLPNIASIPMGVAMGKAASAGTRDKYRLEQIAHAVIFADDNALEHHGIKGQKWGVRRFQDEAGRLTSAGKKRAAELRDKVTSKLKINAKSIDFEAQGGGGGGTIDGWEDVSKEDEVTLNDQKASLVLFLDRGMMSEEEVKELAEAFGYEFDDSLPMDVHLRRLSEAVQKTSGSDLKEAMFNFQQIQRKKVSYSEGIANGVSAVVNALFSSNLAAVADPVLFVKDVISAEKAKAAAEKRKRGEPVDEETGLHIKQNTDASREEDLKDVNPGWKNLATNTKHNCMCCTATYDMRRRGYDVTANEVQFGYDYGDVTRWYPDAKVERLDTVDLERKYVHKSSEESQKQYKQEVNEQLQKELVAQGDGARGNLMVTWDSGGGHSMAYEVVNGVAYVYDGQANMKLDTMNVVAIANNIQYARLDNVDFDPEKIKEVVH